MSRMGTFISGCVDGGVWGGATELAKEMLTDRFSLHFLCAHSFDVMEEPVQISEPVGFLKKAGPAVRQSLQLLRSMVKHGSFLEKIRIASWFESLTGWSQEPEEGVISEYLGGMAAALEEMMSEFSDRDEAVSGPSV